MHPRSQHGRTKAWGRSATWQGFVTIAFAVRGLAAEPSLSYRLPTILPHGRWPLLRFTVAILAK